MSGRPGHSPAIPRDLVDEIDRELGHTCRVLVRELNRLEQLIELNRLVLDTSLRLGRPACVFELFEDREGDPTEHVAALVRLLREGGPRA